MTPSALTAALKEEAFRLGFDLAGATPAVPAAGLGRFRQWLADGFAGQMGYLSALADAREHPQHVLPGVQSILMLAMVYRSVEPVPAGPGQGTIARYAWGLDYHAVVRQALRRLAELHRRLAPGAAVRGVVDTAPLLEREFAQLAGLGSIGKNTLLVNRRLGSWLVLAALLSSQPLEYDQPAEASFCGDCRACLDACPTGALVEPYRLDARKCISYLTIESPAEPPEDALRRAMGPRLFGCDACQEACPWNRATPASLKPEFQPRPGMNPVDLARLVALDEPAFRLEFQGTALVRAGRARLVQRAAAILGRTSVHPMPPTDRSVE